jgi:GNAT superfamily N-acetyltransferase
VTVVIRSALEHEFARLKEIAVRSKAHWGYPLDEVRSWAERGDFEPEQLGKLTVFVAEADGRAVGWCSLISRDEVCWLEDLWVEPEWIRRGVGRRLFRHAADDAAANGAKRLEWEAEPNALGFYERMGAEYVRESETTEWGRTLSIMGVAL